MLGSLAVAAFLYYYSPVNLFDARPEWQEKEREVRSRLLSIPILLYHNIDGKGPFSISSDVLEKHFKLFRESGVRVISLSELVGRLEKPEPFKGKTVVITFDDGFYSMYSKLLPLAKKYGYPVTLFVYTDFIYQKGDRVLTWDLLARMNRQGIDIQCHTITHADLTVFTALDTPEASKMLYDELYLSKRIIELYLKKDAEFFAFPYGRYNVKLIELCLLAGYRRVFSTDYGSNIITRDNYSLCRQHIKNNFTLRFIEHFIR